MAKTKVAGAKKTPARRKKGAVCGRREKGLPEVGDAVRCAQHTHALATSDKKIVQFSVSRVFCRPSLGPQSVRTSVRTRGVGEYKSSPRGPHSLRKKPRPTSQSVLAGSTSKPSSAGNQRSAAGPATRGAVAAVPQTDPIASVHRV